MPPRMTQEEIADAITRGTTYNPYEYTTTANAEEVVAEEIEEVPTNATNATVYTTTFTTPQIFTTGNYNINYRDYHDWINRNAVNDAIYGYTAEATDVHVSISDVKAVVQSMLEEYLKKMYKVVTDHVNLDITEEEFMAIMNGSD